MAKNPDRVLENGRRWIRNNGEKNRAHVKAWRDANPDKKKAMDKRYREENLEKCKARSKQYREENKEYLKFRKAFEDPLKVTERRRRHYLKNREKRIAYATEFKRNNRDYYNALHALRRARKRESCPRWLTREHHLEMRKFYTLAADVSFIMQSPFQVDHIVPLMGKNFCGLHVPWNLQVLSAEENNRKRNNLPPELRGWF